MVPTTKPNCMNKRHQSKSECASHRALSESQSDVMSLKYNCTQVDVKDQDVANQMTSTDITGKPTVAVVLVEQNLRTSWEVLPIVTQYLVKSDEPAAEPTQGSRAATIFVAHAPKNLSKTKHFHRSHCSA